MIAPSQTIPLDFGDAGSITGHRAVQIRGKNPTEAQIRGKVDAERRDENNNLDDHWYAYAILEHETLGWRQFNSVGASYRNDLGPNFANIHGGAMPNFGYPDGWGISQRDPWPGLDEVWNWHENIVGYIEELDDKREDYALTFEGYIRNTYDEIEWNIGGVTYKGFGYTTKTVTVTTDTNPPKNITYSDPIDAMTIVFYNGASESKTKGVRPINGNVGYWVEFRPCWDLSYTGISGTEYQGTPYQINIDR